VIKGKPDGEGPGVKTMGSGSVMNRLNRTFICSVVFLDIFEYSSKSVDHQIRQKNLLNRFVVEAIKDVAVNDRIILDTGDGAAIGFLGDPEDAMFVALNLRDAILEDQKAGNLPLFVRIGMNLGPVKLVKDINGRPNLIGDGINVAQRVMAFAQPGQVLVSRSYYEVVSCLSQEYANLFHYLGMKADKHIREHEIYAVEQVKEEIPPLAPPSKEKESEAPKVIGEVAPPSGAQLPEERKAEKKIGPTSAQAEKAPSSMSPARTSRKGLFIAVPVVAALIVVAALVLFKSKSADTAEDLKTEEAGTVLPIKSGEPPPIPAEKDPTVSKPSTQALAAKASAFILLEIKPSGDIYVDGKMMGSSPPMEFVQVPPGRHKIEIKNSSYKAYTQTIELKPSENIKISHVFR
jgi:hypothetical protein